MRVTRLEKDSKSDLVAGTGREPLPETSFSKNCLIIELI